jgi:hypothetical protein
MRLLDVSLAAPEQSFSGPPPSLSQVDLKTPELRALQVKECFAKRCLLLRLERALRQNCKRIRSQLVSHPGEPMKSVTNKIAALFEEIDAVLDLGLGVPKDELVLKNNERNRVLQRRVVGFRTLEP